MRACSRNAENAFADQDFRPRAMVDHHWRTGKHPPRFVLDTIEMFGVPSGRCSPATSRSTGCSATYDQLWECVRTITPPFTPAERDRRCSRTMRARFLYRDVDNDEGQAGRRRPARAGGFPAATAGWRGAMGRGVSRISASRIRSGQVVARGGRPLPARERKLTPGSGQPHGDPARRPAVWPWLAAKGRIENRPRRPAPGCARDGLENLLRSRNFLGPGKVDRRLTGQFSVRRTGPGRKLRRSSEGRPRQGSPLACHGRRRTAGGSPRRPIKKRMVAAGAGTARLLRRGRSRLPHFGDLLGASLPQRADQPGSTGSSHGDRGEGFRLQSRFRHRDRAPASACIAPLGRGEIVSAHDEGTAPEGAGDLPGIIGAANASRREARQRPAAGTAAAKPREKIGRRRSRGE